MKNKIQKALVALHIATWILVLTLYLITPDKDFIRWNFDIICWGVIFLTAIMIFIFKRDKMKISSYLVLGFILSVTVSIIYFKCTSSPKVAETSHYVVRHFPDGFIDPGDFRLYQKEGILEKYHSVLSDDGFFYNFEDFQEYEKWSVVSFCLKGPKELDGSHADSQSSYFIVSIDEQRSQQYRNQIDSLKLKLNATEKGSYK